MNNIIEIKQTDAYMIETLELLLKLARKGILDSIVGVYVSDGIMEYIIEGPDFETYSHIGYLESLKIDLLAGE